MPTELKPCPFCGGEAVLCKDVNTTRLAYTVELAYVKCNSCGCNTGSYVSDNIDKGVQNAINAWNRRVGEHRDKSSMCFGCGNYMPTR